MSKRTEYISWDKYFMSIAYLSSKRSKDPSTQVGACIVKDKKIIGIGYNGFPYGSDDDVMPWSKDGDILETKYPYVVHAELNAILNSIKNLENSTIYVTHHPCNECAKAIIQSKITKVIYYSDKHKNHDMTKASKRMLENAKIEVLKYSGDDEKICLEFID